jgi:hypothetical protein
MRNTAVFGKGTATRTFLFIAAASILGACQTGPSPEEIARQKAEAENLRLTAELRSRDSLIGDMTLSFDDIEKNLELVRERKELVDKAADTELSLDQRKRIVRDLQLINGLMQDSRDRIAELTKRLDKSKIDASGLRKRLKDLDMQLAMRDSSITLMKSDLLAKDFQITQVNEKLTSIELEIAKREAVILQQETEINKAYMAMGTFKELETQGVLTKEGGLIGIGKRTEVREDVTHAKFKEVDVRTLHTVPLNADKAKLVTDHPKDSYRLVEEDDKLAYLEIKDPEQFWKLSRYMVVEVK